MSYTGDIKHVSRPRIGITMRLELATNRFYLGRDYSEAVENAGGIPVHVSLIPRRDYIARVMDELDGVLLPGSDSDVDPTRYGAEPHPQLGPVVDIKDETDLLMLDEIERRGVPLFAICFGLQILNASRGGTLIQDISSQFPNAIKHEQGVPRDRRSHRVQLAAGSMVHGSAGRESALVNSHHHQALETVGRDLKATAWASDGLIEAVEDTRGDRFAVAVQWHPEIAWQSDELSQALFTRFVNAAREFAASANQPALSVKQSSETPYRERAES